MVFTSENLFKKIGRMLILFMIGGFFVLFSSVRDTNITLFFILAFLLLILIFAILTYKIEVIFLKNGKVKRVSKIFNRNLKEDIYPINRFKNIQIIIVSGIGELANRISYYLMLVENSGKFLILPNSFKDNFQAQNMANKLSDFTGLAIDYKPKMLLYDKFLKEFIKGDLNGI